MLLKKTIVLKYQITGISIPKQAERQRKTKKCLINYHFRSEGHFPLDLGQMREVSGILE